MSTPKDARPPATSRGRRTRQHIVEVAATLMLADGVAKTTLAQVCSAAGVNSSQIYHYFEDKSALVREVIDYQTQRILRFQDRHFEQFTGWETWSKWRDDIVTSQRVLGTLGGCPVGSLAAELSTVDDLSREVLATSFAAWEGRFFKGLGIMRADGLIRADVDIASIATHMMAVLQGGLLLSQTRRDSGQSLSVALDVALQNLAQYAKDPVTK